MNFEILYLQYFPFFLIKLFQNSTKITTFASVLFNYTFDSNYCPIIMHICICKLFLFLIISSVNFWHEHCYLKLHFNIKLYKPYFSHGKKESNN